MTEMIYEYDGSFEGFLTCIFESYAQKEVLTAISCGEDIPFTLFPVRTVLTDRDHAARVYRKVVKLSPEAADLLRRGFLTCLPDREMHLYRLVVKLLEEGPRFLRDLSDETLYPILRAVRHLNGEVHQYKGFVRFSDLGAYWGAKSSRKTGSCPCCAVTSATATGTNGSSSTTVPTRRPCSTPRAALPSGPWSTSRWPRRMRRRPATACCGSDSTTPSPSGSGKTPAAA